MFPQTRFQDILDQHMLYPALYKICYPPEWFQATKQLLGIGLKYGKSVKEENQGKSSKSIPNFPKEVIYKILNFTDRDFFGNHRF